MHAGEDGREGRDPQVDDTTIRSTNRLLKDKLVESLFLSKDSSVNMSRQSANCSLDDLFLTSCFLFIRQSGFSMTQPERGVGGGI